MTSQGMVAWAINRWGSQQQRDQILPLLVSGGLAAVAFSEAQAGSDLAAIQTEITVGTHDVVVTGTKVWVTDAAYADVILVLGRCGDGTALVAIPSNAPGLRVRRYSDPAGCRAAGHADVELDHVSVDAWRLRPGAGAPAGILAQSVLSAGRLSVAWGCLGMIRGCLNAAVGHAVLRRQSGRRLLEHQLVAARIGEMVAAEQMVLRLCECIDGPSRLPGATRSGKASARSPDASLSCSSHHA